MQTREQCVGLQGEALQQMQALVQRAVGPDWRPLPQAMQKAIAYQDTINALVFDVLMAKVRFSGTFLQLSCCVPDTIAALVLHRCTCP